MSVNKMCFEAAEPSAAFGKIVGAIVGSAVRLVCATGGSGFKPAAGILGTKIGKHTGAAVGGAIGSVIGAIGGLTSKDDENKEDAENELF